VIKIHPETLFSALGLYSEYAELESWGAEVASSNKNLIIHHADLPAGETVSLQFVSGVLGSVMSGKLEESEVLSLRVQLKQAAAIMVNNLMVFAESGGISPVLENVHVDQSPVLATSAHPMLVAQYEEIKDGEPVKLAMATRLYQPVLGTSGGSRYFLVARGGRLVVGARLRDGKLSVRVEALPGQSITEKDKAVWGDVGFSVEKSKIDNGYMSEHLQVGTTMMANKVLGSMLVGFGGFEMVGMPNMDKVEKHGV